ncbi:MAG: uracil phosphoribosyltransferase [Acidobacteria bacterium]|nr:uracil phosphoribosyltransferase [Acidobacteriota bacterium]
MSFNVVDHPLIAHKLGIMRNVECTISKFRDLSREITNLLTYEATRDMEVEDAHVQGWAGTVKVKKLSGKKVAVVPILRAGVGMLDGVLDLIPSARVNFLGMYRNEETLEPVAYFQKLCDDIHMRTALIVDPMLATGNSLSAAIHLLKRSGCPRIKALCLVAAPEGVKVLTRGHPDVDVFVAALDDRLNERGYILPGLGDAGDRLFGTR